MPTETVSRIHYDQIKRSLASLIDAYNTFGHRVQAEMNATAQRFAAQEAEIEALAELTAVSSPSLVTLHAKQALDTAKEEWEARFRKLYGIPDG